MKFLPELFYLLNYFFPVSVVRSFSQIMHLGLYAATGGLIYFVLIYTNGAFAEVFGQNAIDKILRKLKLKKS